MKKADIYLGTINAFGRDILSMSPLYKINDKDYAVLEWMKGIADYFWLLLYVMGMSKAPNFVLSSFKAGSLMYVDSASLSNFYGDDELNQNVTIPRVMNDWMLDPRVPVGQDIGETGMVMYKRRKMPKKN